MQDPFDVCPMVTFTCSAANIEGTILGWFFIVLFFMKSKASIQYLCSHLPKLVV